MIRQPRSDQLVAVALATSIHVALGCMLFMAARAGIARPGPADSNVGRAIVIQLVPLERAAVARPVVGNNDKPRIAAALPRRADSAAVNGTRAQFAPLLAALPRSSNDLADTSASETAHLDARAMADLPSAEVLDFRTRLQSHLARYRLYPASAKDAGNQGVVSLHFIMNRDGRIAEAWIETSSGIPDIDREALAAVRRAVPLPPLPSSFPDALDIRLPVAFKLD